MKVKKICDHCDHCKEYFNDKSVMDYELICFNPKSEKNMSIINKNDTCDKWKYDRVPTVLITILSVFTILFVISLFL